MSFGLPNSLRRPYSLHNNNSQDSFGLQLDDSLDAALDNLQVYEHEATQPQKASTIDEPKESFELASLNQVDKESLHDRRPLLDAAAAATAVNEPFRTQTAPNPSIASRISQYWEFWKHRDRIELNRRNAERSITATTEGDSTYPDNAISNAKYNPVTFIPKLLYEQFKFFYNLYFLVVALSQAIPVLKIGYLSSYVVPLAFVLTVTMAKEALDDFQRRRRDKAANSELYEVLSTNSSIMVASKDLRVGQLLKIEKGARIPADVVLLQTSDSSAEAFIKTDQLDGETDWKLKIPSPLTQNLPEQGLVDQITIVACPPEKSINRFTGTITYHDSSASSPLSIDNTLWANTVLASTGYCIGMVIYTGKDTRQAMNTTSAKIKTGLLESEINSISKLLCASVLAMSVLLVLFAGRNNADWYVDIMRYLILFSTIIPVSLRVNLDLAKSVYAHQIEHDENIKDTIVRTSTIPEDLGRIEYLLSDKTGTLTQNDMSLKKLHVGSVSYTTETMDIVSDYMRSFIQDSNATSGQYMTPAASKKQAVNRVCDLVVALGICHSVTPTFEEDEISYQAASPDEIAIVKFTESVGLSLFKRDRHSITLLHEYTGQTIEYDILYTFPFNSDKKRMGIIVKDKQRGDYLFIQKGADTVMLKIVESNDWLEEETGNMAREGLRTLVIGQKRLTGKIYDQFVKSYEEAALRMEDRDQLMDNAVSRYLEHDLELLGLTGVEDKSQENVKSSIELLRNAGIKIWMLTGDKVETARCVSISCKLISRGQYVHKITKITKPEGALSQLEYLQMNPSSCLLIDGDSLGIYLAYYKTEFFKTVAQLPTVVACRCSPQQKADIALMIRELTGKRVCCIGDGGNDVSMIQCADVGVGIVGKEGKQASLAADFSIVQFSYLVELLLWHGRNSYKRSAKLAQFVMHRGLVIAVCQAVFSICSDFEPVALYQGWLMVGYATLYTMGPVFSLTLDRDIDESLTKIYPELYKDLTEGKSLSYKTFFVWVGLSLFQGTITQALSQIFTGVDESVFTKMVALSFTALILNELIMVALEIYTWNTIMLVTELVTLAIYIVSVPFLGEYFDLKSVAKLAFYGELLAILAISVFPVWISKTVYRRLHPPSYAKVQQFATA